MDAKVSDNVYTLPVCTDAEEFLMREGLEVLANYRAIADETVRRAVRELIASLTNADLGVQ